jgi:hypothetical protein
MLRDHAKSFPVSPSDKYKIQDPTPTSGAKLRTKRLKPSIFEQLACPVDPESGV